MGELLRQAQQAIVAETIASTLERMTRPSMMTVAFLLIGIGSMLAATARSTTQ